VSRRHSSDRGSDVSPDAHNALKSTKVAPILDYLGTELIPVSWQSAHRCLSHKPGVRLMLLSDTTAL